MNRIEYSLIPGGQKGQMSYEERLNKAKEYIKMLEDDGKVIVSTEFLSNKVVIITED